MSRWLWSEVRLFRARGVQAIIPTVLLVAVSGLALTLIVAIIARSPYTHANLSSEGYDRTEIVYVGDKQPVRLPAGGKDLPAGAADRGRSLFMGLNCAACHGLKGQGAIVAPVIIGTDASTLATYMRKNPAGMPAYEGITDEDFKGLAAFLQAASGPGGTTK